MRSFAIARSWLSSAKASMSSFGFDGSNPQAGVDDTDRVQAKSMDIRESYDSAAEAYAEHLASELVSLDFRFHVPRAVVEALRSARLEVIEHVEREPYEGAEYPSRRCYLLAKAA